LISKSAQIKRYGASDIIEINQTTPTPNLAAGNVLVEIKAAGINPIDWKIREGYMQQRIPLQFLSTLGMDFSGLIKQASEGESSDFKQGDEVYGQAGVTNGGSGAFAELALANADHIAHKPKRLNHLKAAALPLVGVSVWQALVENMRLSKDQKIIIHGGAGGIGSIAIQLAKKLGAYVATTVSTKDKQFVEELGADEVIDYKTQALDLIHNCDAAYDTVGGETCTRSSSLKERRHNCFDVRAAKLMHEFGVKAIFQFTQVNKEGLRKLAEFVDKQNNNVEIHIDKTFPLDEARKALDYQKGVHPRGKIVLVIEK
jgi:alcohol dehydrogenase